MRTDWNFQWTPLSITLTAGQSSATLPTDFNILIGDGLQLDTHSVSAISWGDMRDIRQGTLNTTRPSALAVAPDGTLYFNAIADQNYTLTGHYFTTPVSLANNTDTPALPSHFHMLIVYKAMMFYGAYENAPEVAQSARLSFEQMLADVMRSELPEVEMPGTIA